MDTNEPDDPSASETDLNVSIQDLREEIDEQIDLSLRTRRNYPLSKRQIELIGRGLAVARSLMLGPPSAREVALELLADCALETKLATTDWFLIGMWVVSLPDTDAERLMCAAFAEFNRRAFFGPGSRYELRGLRSQNERAGLPRTPRCGVVLDRLAPHETPDV